MLLWLWYRPAAAVPIRPLAWEPLCAAGAALEMANKQKNLVIPQDETRDNVTMFGIGY